MAFCLAAEARVMMGLGRNDMDISDVEHFSHTGHDDCERELEWLGNSMGVVMTCL